MDSLVGRLPPMSKICKQCGGEFSRKRGRSVKSWETRLFCSRPCAHKGIDRPGQPQLTRCKSGLHEMSGDNLRIDLNGRRSCKACARQRAREAELRDPERFRRERRARNQRYTARNRGTVPVPRRAKPKPATPVETASPAIPPRWRPPGWLPTPAVGRKAS